jgi:hypothetical protein
LHSDHFPYELVWRPFHHEQRRFPFLPIGSTAQTPPVHDFLQSTGRLNLPSSICSEEGVVLVTTPSFLPVLSQFVREHSGQQVEFELAHQARTFSAWRCRDQTGGRNLRTP